MSVVGGWFAALLLVATPLLPLGLLLWTALAASGRRWIAALLSIAPLPGLAAALWARDTSVTFDHGRLQIGLTVDGPRAILLGASALLWSLAGAYTARALADDPRRIRFVVAWLLSLSGCLGVFIAADLGSFYLLYALVSLAAWGLVVHDGTPGARRAAALYVGLAVIGEALLLLAFVLLADAGPGESLRIDHVVAGLAASPRRDQTLVFLLLGFGLKMGLVPLHGWLPIAHPAAPAPGSAVLSGAIIKTGVIGMVLFLPLGTAGLDPALRWEAGWGHWLVVVGFVTAFYTAMVGLSQSNPKTVLAYSSASQMGVVAALIGVGVMQADATAPTIATFYALHHVLTKGALFLGVGVLAVASRGQHRALLIVLLLLGLSIPGLPFSGGSVAKLATKALFDTGPLKLLATLSAIASTMLMLHFALRLWTKGVPSDSTAPRGMLMPWALLALAAVVLPWILLPATTGIGLGAALSLGALWAALWPILAGAAGLFLLRALLAAWKPLARRAEPTIPEGDIIVLLVRGWQAGGRLSRACDPLDRLLRTWWVAGGLLVAALVVMGLVAGGRG